MKIVSISDTHTLHKGVIIPECDILIHSGDVSTRGYITEIKNFLEWFAVQPARYLVLIAGNHDFGFQTKPEDVKALLLEYPNIIYLQDEEVIIEGYKIYGTPWQPWFHDWAFNLHRGAELKAKWDLIPMDTEILVTHGPPFGYGDFVLRTGEKVGCDELLKKIRTLKQLKINQFGHIHQGYGVYHDCGVYFINASILNEEYEVANDPIITELPDKV